MYVLFLFKINNSLKNRTKQSTPLNENFILSLLSPADPDKCWPQTSTCTKVPRSLVKTVILIQGSGMGRAPRDAWTASPQTTLWVSLPSGVMWHAKHDIRIFSTVVCVMSTRDQKIQHQTDVNMKSHLSFPPKGRY